MKRIIGLIVGVLLVFSLTACTEDVYVEPGVIAVQYENIRYDGDSILVDVWITNGTESDYAFDYMEFWLEVPEAIAAENNLTGEGEAEVCGAGFYFDENIPSNGWVAYELEFTSEYIFISDSTLQTYGLTLNDLDLYFWNEE